MSVDGIQTYRGLAHPWMCDILGFLNVRHYAAMFDDAVSELLEHISGDVTERQMGWLDKRTVIEYHEGVRSGDFIVIQSLITHISSSSVTILQTLIGSDQTVRACNETVMTRIQLPERIPANLSDAVISKARTLLTEDADKLSNPKA